MSKKVKYGQYFTSDELSEKITKLTLKHIEHPINILEPSCGAGDIIKQVKRYLPNSKVDSYEIDNTISNDFNVTYGDFLFSEIDKEYDAIIGNPPYIELVYSFYSGNKVGEFKSRFGKKGRGRINLLHAFFDRAFELIKDGGVISYLIPSTILSSPWYTDIREHIYENYTIKEIIEDVNFQGVSIQVSLLVIKKEKDMNHNHIYKIGDSYIISEKNTFTDGITIKDLGFKVGVGKYCWSHYKTELSNSEGLRLLYSSYITENGLIEKQNRNKDKKPFLNIKNPVVISNAIVFPRTISKKVKIGLVLDGNYLFENHVVYITHDDKDMLVKLYDYFKNDSDNIGVVFNSVTLTKGEVENFLVNNDFVLD